MVMNNESPKSTCVGGKLRRGHRLPQQRQHDHDPGEARHQHENRRDQRQHGHHHEDLQRRAHPLASVAGGKTPRTSGICMGLSMAGRGLRVRGICHGPRRSSQREQDPASQCRASMLANHALLLSAGNFQQPLGWRTGQGPSLVPFLNRSFDF
jgi:hypothetical protein